MSRSALINKKMISVYVSDYFLFTFLASFGVLQIALGRGITARTLLGTGILVFSYVWFFTVRDRNVHTAVEGSQLFIIFGLGAISAIIVTRIFNFLAKKK